MTVSEELVQRHDFAQTLILEAGQVAMSYFDRFETLEVHSKGIQDMASEADLTVEQLIRDRIAAAFPGDDFLGEESVPTLTDDTVGVWVVDPIDGTQPFVNGLATWCVSIAFVAGGKVQFGLVYNPVADELFDGGTWFPATKNGRIITPSPAEDLTGGLTYIGASPRVKAHQVVPMLDRLLKADGMYVRIGSGALGLCDVACGRLIGYVEAHINSWDCLGAIGVLEAAGCRVNDYLTGDALLKGNRIIAGTPAVYDDLVGLMEGID